MGFEVCFKEMPIIKSSFPLTARELLAKTNFPKKDQVVACRVNNAQRPLSWVVDMDSSIDFITTDSIEGIEVYTRTLMFMLTSAASRICGIRLRLAQSMNYSYYYENPDGPITEEQCKAIAAEMRRMVSAGTPFIREEVSIDKARAIMESQGYGDKEALLRWLGTDPVVLYRCEGIYDTFASAIADTAAIVPTFDLHLYKGGIFLSGPTLTHPARTFEFKTSAKTLKLFQSYSKWLEDLDLRTMDKIHELVAQGRARDLLMVCEALHTKVLGEVCNNIESRPDVRLLCLAGPSSSGKTTSSRRLRVQLLTSGIRSVTIELDNYFVDRDKTPLDADGKLDFEALEALDTDLINEHLIALIEGKQIEVPKFDFITGKRTKGYNLRIAPNEILVIEGIHGLNEKVTEQVPQERKYGIFICPLTGTNIDMHNRIGTTDTRLFRRMVRDYRTRGHSPEATLLRWPSVVRGSHRHIFPYQEKADTLFNTALAYELPVIKGYAVPLLKSVPEKSEAFGEAQRLLSILDAVPIIPSDDVPNTSIFREFIGGSCFE
ncbi:nucleoside kinase [Synergistaceae bacterium OttesenSCG-928-D05]|nr:nucleoside kinase [Synergistaceae bacterium OttesenSCG-928-D05]